MTNSSRPKDIHFTQRVAHFHIGEAGTTEYLAFQYFDLENDGHDSSLKTLVVFFCRLPYQEIDLYMKLNFCVPGHPSAAATLLLLHTCLRQKKKMISGAAGWVKACSWLFFISSIVQMQTSRNSHCVDFVLLDGAEMYSAQSWCINLLISPLYYSYIKPQLQNEEV